MSNPSVTINIRPRVALIDEVVHIEVSGLSPCHHATLVCRVSEKGGTFFSSAIYRSDITGMIDVSTMAAIDGGTYTGVEPMGLIWSMIQEPGQKRGRRLLKSDVTTPLVTHIYVLHGVIQSHQCLTEIEDKNYLVHTTFDRMYMAEGVERIEVRHGRLVGTMFLPAGQGPFPGVLDLFGNIGGIVEDRAAQLASRGVATLALGYVHKIHEEGQATDLEYFEEALDYLLSHQKVIKPSAGVLGTSLGGLYAAALGAFCPKIKVCILVNGHCIAGGNEMTYRGQRLPRNDFDFDLVQYSDVGLIWKYFYAKEHVEKMTPVPVEKGSCTYVLIHGEDDQCVGPEIASYIPSRLKRNGKTNYRVYIYPGAGHLIHPPYNPHYYSTYQPSNYAYMVWGGRKQEHYKAEVEAWKTILYYIKSELVPQTMNAVVPESRL